MTPNPFAGRFFVFEGLDGSGQTTQAKLLVQWLRKLAIRADYTKEPTTGPVGEVLRSVLGRRLVLPAADAVPDDVTMALLFAADRAHHLQSQIVPKLRQGVHVVSDRYVLSSLAYQSGTVGYDWVRSINRHIERPDVTFYLEVQPATAMQRIAARGASRDLYEDRDRLERVARAYAEAIRRLQAEGERVAVIDAERGRDAIHRDIVSLVASTIGDSKLDGADPLADDEIATYLGAS
jgi:dTMP kinase